MDAVNWWAVWIWQTADETFEMDAGQIPERTTCPDRPRNTIRTSRCSCSRPKRPPHTKASCIKICESSHRGATVRTAAVSAHHQRAELDDHDRRSTVYLVTVEEHIVVRAIDFVQQSSIVRYQICTRYCDDHGYMTAADARPATRGSRASTARARTTDAHAGRHRHSDSCWPAPPPAASPSPADTTPARCRRRSPPHRLIRRRRDPRLQRPRWRRRPPRRRPRRRGRLPRRRRPRRRRHPRRGPRRWSSRPSRSHSARRACCAIPRRGRRPTCACSRASP